MTLRHLAGKKPASKKKKVSPVKGKALRLVDIPEDPDLPRGHLSVSQVEMYLRCPKQYEYRYVDGLVLPPGVALIEGGTHHDTVEFNNICKVDSGEDEDVDTVIEFFEDMFDTNSKELTKAAWKQSGDKKDNVISRGRTFLKNYMEGLAPKIKPACKPEQQIELMLGDVPVLGYVDLQEKKQVWDYKVVKSAKSQNDANNDLQLTVYSEATGLRKVGFICFTKGNGAVKVIESERGEGDTKAAAVLFSSVSSSIKKGAFPLCNPTNIFPCSRKWCGYWNKCRGRHIKW